MLLKLNKRILFILAVLTILIIIPCSFASDLDNQTLSIDDNHELSVDDGEIVADGDKVIYVENGDNEGNGSIDNPYNSISNAVVNYNSSQNSKIFIKNGNYDITEQITIQNKEVNIVGESRSGTILNANFSNSIFNLDTKSKVTFTNITFINANSQAAIVIDHATSLSIDNCTFDNNLKGAIYKKDYSNTFDLIINNSLFSNNRNNDGGAISITSGTIVNITNTVFENNAAPAGETDSSQGGAIYCGGNLNVLYVDLCTFINNTATRGSAISQYYTGDVYVYNSRFINNTSPGSSRYNVNSSVIDDIQGEGKGFILYLKNNVFEYNKLNDDIVTKNVEIRQLDKNTRIVASNVDKIYGDDFDYIVTLTDINGTPLSGKHIIALLTNNYDGQVTTIENFTDSNGKAVISLRNQKPGKYSTIAKFEGDGELDSVYTNNNIFIRSESSYNVIFDENPVKMMEGDSHNITAFIYDEYFVPTNDLNGKSFSVDWYDYNNKHMAIDVNSVRVQGNKLVWDINRLHLVTRDVPYEVHFNIGDSASANLTVDLSVNMSNIDPTLDTYYVSVNGSDVAGDGSESNPLASLQTALFACRYFGGEKTVIVGEGTYEISTFNVLSNVTIIGQKSKTILKQTGGILGMLEFDNGNIASLINLTFIDGYATPSPDALIHVTEDSTVYIDGCEFMNNSAVEGGAISISFGGKVYINNSYFHDNKAILGKNGGAIYVDRGYLYISNSLFENNTAGDGGAIYLGFPAEALIVNTTFINNTARGSSSVGGSGGAIFTRSNNLSVENSTFIENFADYGGAIFIDYGAVNVYKSYFENNKVKVASAVKGSAIQGSYISYYNLTINYSILISEQSNNDLYLVYLPNIDENHTVDVEYNFWKTNSQKSNIGSNYSAIIEISTENEFIYTGDVVEFAISFVKYNVYEGNSPLDDFMHDFDLLVMASIGEIAESDVVTVKNNKAMFYYNATTVGSENIRVGNIFQIANYRFDVQDGSGKVKLNPTINISVNKKATITVTFDQNVTGIITVRIGESEYSVEIFDSKASLTIDVLPGNYTAKIIFKGDNNYRGFVENVPFSVAKYKTNVTIGEAEIYYNSNYQAKLTDDEGNAISGEKLTLKVNSTSYEAITDENGIATFELNLTSTGNFNVEVKYSGNSIYDASSANSSINVVFATIKLNAQVNATITPIKGEFSVTLTDNKNNPIRNTKVIFNFKGSSYENLTDNNGIATLKLNDNGLDVGKYDISAEVAATAVYSGDKVETKITVIKATAVLKADEVTVFANSGEFKVTLTDDEGNPLNNTNITVKIGNGVEKVITTNESGIAILPLSLSAGNYSVVVKLAENKVYQATDITSNINVKENIVNIIAPDVTVYYSNGKFTVVLHDVDGNPIPDERLIVTIDNDYLVTTDQNGIATVNINNLPIGTYVILTKFEGNSIFQAKNTTSTLKIISSISAHDMKRAYNSPYDFQAILKDSNGNPVANKNVNLLVNGKKYTGKTNANGILNFASKLAVGTYAITVENPATGEKTSNYATIVKRLTGNKNVNMYFGANKLYKVRVIGDDGKAVGKGQIVKINIAGKNKNVKTDKNSYASYKLNTLKAKTYTITATYKGVKVSNKIVVKPVLTAKNISKKKAKKIKFSAKLVNTKGKALKGKKITFKIKGKTYKVKTNKKGVATVTLKNLKVGKHKITVKYGKSTIKKTIKIKK